MPRRRRIRRCFLTWWSRAVCFGRSCTFAPAGCWWGRVFEGFLVSSFSLLRFESRCSISVDGFLCEVVCASASCDDIRSRNWNGMSIPTNTESSPSYPGMKLLVWFRGCWKRSNSYQNDLTWIPSSIKLWKLGEASLLCSLRGNIWFGDRRE